MTIKIANASFNSKVTKKWSRPFINIKAVQEHWRENRLQELKSAYKVKPFSFPANKFDSGSIWNGLKVRSSIAAFENWNP